MVWLKLTASIFEGVFARSLLLELAKADGIAQSEVELAYLIDNRCILSRRAQGL